MLFGKEVLALLVAVAVAGRPAQGRAVVREDVKGVASLLRDEARGDPFFDDNPQYDFAYRIHDEETGDAKDQSEERRGDAVHGSYSVVDPDGTLRVVRYTADDANGFNAVVSLTPGHAKPFVPKPAVQRRVAVVQNHVDVPVPVQHHVLPSTSQQTLGDRRVLVEHPKHQTGALLQEHLIQPPLAFGLHQDVHHLIPRGPTYQLHHIHQLSPSGVGTHHQMTVPIVQVQNQGEMDAQQQHVAFLQLQEEQLKEQLKQQQAKIQAMIEAQQENQLPLKQLQEQKDTPTQVQGLQDHPPAEQQQTSQQQDEQTQQDSNTLQGPQDTASLQQDASSQQGIQQQDVTAQQQQTNAIPQQQGENGGFALPQVIDVRHSVIPKSEPAQALVSQLRSLHSEVASPAASPAASPQRTLAVYRTSYGMRGGSNFITFNSPYAQYTIS